MDLDVAVALLRDTTAIPAGSQLDEARRTVLAVVERDVDVSARLDAAAHICDEVGLHPYMGERLRGVATALRTLKGIAADDLRDALAEALAGRS